MLSYQKERTKAGAACGSRASSCCRAAPPPAMHAPYTCARPPAPKRPIQGYIKLQDEAKVHGSCLQCTSRHATAAGPAGSSSGVEERLRGESPLPLLPPPSSAVPRQPCAAAPAAAAASPACAGAGSSAAAGAPGAPAAGSCCCCCRKRTLNCTELFLMKPGLSRRAGGRGRGRAGGERERAAVGGSRGPVPAA